MRKTFRSIRIVSACTLVVGLGVFGTRLAHAAKDNTPNECLVGIENSDSQVITTTQSCTDGDSCDADGATNGVCVFRIKGCVNIPDPNCTPRPIKKVKFVAPHSKDKVSLTPISGSTSSACGAFVDFHVALKKKGKKPAKTGKRKINASATADVKPAGKNKDADKIEFDCNPCPTDNCVPPTTTTTTTTSSSTTTIPAVPFCGDGSVNGTEQCDPAAAATGCSGGDTCMPAGSISECTCKTCTPISPAQTMQFTTSTATADYCGDAGLLSPGALGTSSGTVTTDTNSMLPLGAGCLYLGGGGSTVPGGLIPDGSQSNFDLTLACGTETVVAGRAPTNAAESRTCTKGAGPGKACINKLDNWPNLQSCTTDANCPHTGPKQCSGGTNAGASCVTDNDASMPCSAGGGTCQPTIAPGSCVDTPNCLFGPPLPIPNGGLGTCVVNTIGTDASGSIMPTTGDAQVTLPLRSHTFVKPGTQPDDKPCPTCEAGVCVGGQRDGLACTTTSTGELTTIDCPPIADGGSYLPEFQVNLQKLTTGTSSKTNVNGIFCPSQQTFSAFGTQNRVFRPDGDPLNPPIKIVTITENGSPAGDVTDHAAHAATLAAAFCIPATGNGLIDGAADLPGPGAVSLPGTVQILP